MFPFTKFSLQYDQKKKSQSISLCSEAFWDEASRYDPTAEPHQNQCALTAEEKPPLSTCITF